MPMPWDAVIAGATDLATNLFSSSASARQARDQMAFQERMRSTQYQTSVRDMRAAGLNPNLAFDQGGAGTPGGAMGQPPDLSGVVSSALAAKRVKGELAKMEAEIGLMKDQGHKVDAERQTTLEHGREARLRGDAIEQDLRYKRVRGSVVDQIGKGLENVRGGIREFKRRMQALPWQRGRWQRDVNSAREAWRRNN